MGLVSQLGSRFAESQGSDGLTAQLCLEFEARGLSSLSIGLEDDWLPDPTFLPFVTFAREADYYVSRNTHIWGWATWRRAWQHFDSELAAWPQRRDTDCLVG